jgi:hypothetical protein
MIGITRLSNEGEIHYFKLVIHNEIHNELINLFYELGFSSEPLDKLDIIFSEMINEYFFIKFKNIKVHFFVEEKRVNMVIDWKISQQQLTKKMSPYFIFPKRI